METKLVRKGSDKIMESGIVDDYKTQLDQMKDTCGDTIMRYDFEYWSSLDTRYIILTIEAESKTVAVKEFKKRHPHKKYRQLDPLDEKQER